MCILPQAAVPAPPCPAPAAHRLLPAQREQLALNALAGHSVSALAQEHQVSRKFVYQQLHQAQDALDQVFAPAPADQDVVLFTLPITKDWLRQFVLGLLLICHSSLRGVTELLADLFAYPLSLGTVHNILQQAVTAARGVNSQADLSRIRLGAHDEIFQGGQPVLVGADVASTYCSICSAWRRTATPTPGACACWSWPTAASNRKRPSPTSPGACGPRRWRCYPGSPAGAISFTCSMRLCRW